MRIVVKRIGDTTDGDAGEAILACNGRVRQVYEIKGIQIAATVEWARFASFDAEMSRATYFSPAIEFSWESLGAAVIYSERRKEFLFSDNLLELNASVTIREGLRIDLSWAELDIEDKGSASLGFGFSYTHEF